MLEGLALATRQPAWCLSLAMLDDCLAILLLRPDPFAH